MRKIAVPLVALALLGAACGSKGSPSDAHAAKATTTTTAADTATTVSVVPTTVVPTTVTTAKPKATTATTAATATPIADTSGGDLKAKLISAADVPAGFVVAADDGSGDEEEVSDDLSGCAAGDAVDAKYRNKFEEEGIDFEKSSSTSYALISESLERYATDTVANAAFDEQSSAMDQCASFATTDDDGNPMHITLSPLAFPSLGDDTFARTMTIQGETDGEPYELTGALIAVRHGRIHASITSMGVGGGMPSTSDLEAIVRRSLAKV